MAANTSVCGICEQRHISNPSIIWCPECEEALCSDCKEHHSLAKSSRGHNTIPMSDYLKLPPIIAEIKQYCDVHHHKYQQYCATHEIPICYKCIAGHGHSCNVIALDDMIVDFKNSDGFLDLKQNLLDLVGNVKRIRIDRETNLKKVHDETQKLISEVREIRLKLNEHLDKLETDIIGRLQSFDHQATEKIQEIITILTQKENDITKYHTTIEDIQRHASDFQAFLGAKEIIPIVEKCDKSIQSFIDDKSLVQFEITCTIDRGIHEILRNINSFGSVEIKSSPTSINVVKKKNKQAQMFTSELVQSIEDIELTLVKDVNTNSTCVRGCCITSNGSVIFTDHGKRFLSIVNKSNMQMNCPSGNAFDVTCIDSNTCAVTSGNSSSHRIDLINLTTLKVTHSVRLPGCPYGITYSGDSMICCVEQKDLHVISRSDDFRISTVNDTKLPGCSYVAALGDNIYYTNANEQTVTCCSCEGTITWKYKNEKVLKNPRGITLDSHGNIFVVGEDSNNVVAISPNGKDYKEILTRNNGIVNPSAVYFNKTTSELLVANKDNGLASLFSVSRKKHKKNIKLTKEQMPYD